MIRRSSARKRGELAEAPTAVCPLCHGTGLNRARSEAYTGSRADFSGDRGLAADQVRCADCEGRGRLSVARLLAERGRIT